MSNEGKFPSEPASKAFQVSFPLPRAPETQISISLTIQASYILLFLTTILNGDTSNSAPLGSFVYALPDRMNPRQSLSTPLYTYESSIEFTTRLANLLAFKTARPVYVGNSVSFASAGMGGKVEEELEGFKKVVEVVLNEVRKDGPQLVNGN